MTVKERFLFSSAKENTRCAVFLRSGKKNEFFSKYVGKRIFATSKQRKSINLWREKSFSNHLPQNLFSSC
ncbi:MAG: hypothetical protein ACI3YC_00030, partial [Alloprevotella sp.]